MTQLSHEERLQILEDYADAQDAGNEVEAEKIIKKLPLAAPVAKAAKETFGAETLLSCGFDLSEAEAVYGKNWLYQ